MSDLLVAAENEGNSPQRGRVAAEVNYVHDEFPTYYRDWKRAFSDLSTTQLVCEPSNRIQFASFGSSDSDNDTSARLPPAPEDGGCARGCYHGF